MNKAFVRYQVGDTVRMKKQHPCGSDLWEITRTGIDFGLKCVGCGRRVMIPRAKFEHGVKDHFPLGTAPPLPTLVKPPTKPRRTKVPPVRGPSGPPPVGVLPLNPLRSARVPRSRPAPATSLSSRPAGTGPSGPPGSPGRTPGQPSGGPAGRPVGRSPGRPASRPPGRPSGPFGPRPSARPGSARGKRPGPKGGRPKS